MDVLGPERQPEPVDLNELKYTEMFIKETLRLFPVAPVIMRTVDEDTDIGEHKLFIEIIPFCLVQ